MSGFKAVDVKRLVKAAQSAGLSVAAVCIDAGGRPFIRIGEPLKAGDNASGESLDDFIDELKAKNGQGNAQPRLRPKNHA